METHIIHDGTLVSTLLDIKIKNKIKTQRKSIYLGRLFLSLFTHSQFKTLKDAERMLRQTQF